ncbi:MAG: BatD family protein [Polyangia bacterium]
MKRALSTLVLVVVGLASARASANRFTATVVSDSVTIADTVQLTVSIERDGNSVLESYRAPSAPDFDIVRAMEGGQQISMTIINGRQSVTSTDEHVYLLRPKKKGALVIGPAVARVGGQELRTQPITVRVGGVPKNMVGRMPGSATEPLPEPESFRGDGDTHVEATADKTRVYVGEQVNIDWRLWAGSQVLNYRSVADPKTDGFWSEDLTPQQREWQRQVTKGREYQVTLLLEKGLFPLKPGKLVVTPLSAEITTMQNAFSANASAVASSKPVEIDVRPLPAEGRPANFPSVNVGHYEMKAAVDRTRVAAGDAVSLKITLSGVGNVHGLKGPRLFDKGEGPDGWRAYEPTVKENIERGTQIRGEKTLTYLLTPLRGGRLSLPALELPYFDPRTQHYEVARTAELLVDVDGDPKRVEPGSSGSATENVLARQVRPLRTHGSLSTHLGAKLFERPRLRAIVLAVPPLLWLLIVVIDSVRRRWTRDTPSSRRRRARANARRRLRIADYNIKANRPPAFFAECARVIYEHLEFRLGTKVESYTLDQLRGLLVERGFTKETSEAIVQELENCDFARFAPSASGPGEMKAAVRRVKALLGFIESERLDAAKRTA